MCEQIIYHQKLISDRRFLRLGESMLLVSPYIYQLHPATLMMAPLAVTPAPSTLELKAELTMAAALPPALRRATRAGAAKTAPPWGWSKICRNLVVPLEMFSTKW